MINAKPFQSPLKRIDCRPSLRKAHYPIQMGLDQAMWLLCC